MPNDKNYWGEEDRERAIKEENWQIDLIEQTGETRQEIEEAIRKVGNNKDKVEEYVRNKRVL